MAKSPVGKYFKTTYAYFYFYAEDELFKHRYACIRVGKDGIQILHLSSLGLLRSTKKAFRKAYARTIETIDGIVEGGK